MTRFTGPCTRRAVLRGLGVALALPFLESAAFADDPPAGKKKRGKPPVRVLFCSIPNGVHMDSWKGSSKTGLSPTLEGLKPIVGDVLIIDNLRHDLARANGDGAGDHARETGTFLTGVQCRKTSGADIQAGVSIDQVLAQRVGHLTPLPSLELGLEHGGAAETSTIVRIGGRRCSPTAPEGWAE